VSDPTEAEREALERLRLIGGPDEDQPSAESILAQVDGALTDLALARRATQEQVVRDLLRQRDSMLKGENGISAETLRRSLDAARLALGVPAPAKSIQLACDCAFEDAHPAEYMRTDFTTLDDYTLGGLWHGRFVVAAGEPNVGKTAFVTQLATAACRRDCAVVFHCADVDKRADIAARIGAAKGVNRAALRRCDKEAQLATSLIMRPWSLKIIDQFADDATIEDSIEVLRDMMRAKQIKRGVLVVDSMQTALCRGLVGPGAPRFEKDKIETLTKALLLATQRGLLVIATSEVPRNFYNSKPLDQPSDMAAVKGSGRVEFALWTLLVLRRLRDGLDGFQLGMPKNKGGRPEGAIKLLYEPDCGTFVDDGPLDYEAKHKDKPGKKAKSQDEHRTAQVKAAEALVPELVRELVDAGRAGLGDRNIRQRLSGGSAVKDRVADIAVKQGAIIRETVRGHERYFAPGFEPSKNKPQQELEREHQEKTEERS
jgi:archaellum biogenesis ATPase FlaH